MTCLCSREKRDWNACAPLRGQTTGFTVLSSINSSDSNLRRPSFIIVPFWVACWVRAFSKSVVVALLVTCVTANNGFHRSITFLSLHTQKTLTLSRAFWCRRWQSWVGPCNQTHHWSWLCCDSFFTCIFLRSFWHHFSTICRTEMANIEQTQMFPFVTCEISLCQYVCELCTWFGSWGPNWFYQTTNQEQLCGFWKRVSM